LHSPNSLQKLYVHPERNNDEIAPNRVLFRKMGGLAPEILFGS